MSASCATLGNTHLATLALTVGISAAILGFSLRSSAWDLDVPEGVWLLTRGLRYGSLIGVLMLGLACGAERPTAPSAVPATPIPVPRTPEPPQPLPSGEPVASYVFHGPLDYRISSFTTGSQYLLYDNGVFGLRYDAFTHVYLGTYQQDNATITFRFDDGWTWDQGRSCLRDSGPTRGLCPFATGTLKGDLLEVRYGDSMQHSDYENAVYRRLQ